MVQQRRKRSGRQNGGVLPSSILGDSTGFHVSDSLSDPTAIVSGTLVTFPVDSIGQPSESLTQSNVSYMFLPGYQHQCKNLYVGLTELGKPHIGMENGSMVN